MTNIILKNRAGTIKGSINTNHDDALFLRDMTASHLTTSGVFQKFGEEGDTLAIERGFPICASTAHVPGAGKLERLCSANYRDNGDEPDASAVTIYHIVDEALMWEIESMLDEGNRAGFDDLVLEILDLHDESGYEIAPGAAYTTYSVERVALELVSVIETRSFNI